jgi:hypothetical protein
MMEVLTHETSQLVSICLMTLSGGGFVAALLTQDKRAARLATPVLLSVFLGALAIALHGALGYLLLFASACVSWWAAKLAQGNHNECELEPCSRAMGVFVALLGIVLASFTFYRLGSYTGMALTWESPVTEDLLAELRGSSSLMTSFTKRLQWNHGVLSGSANSMVFGFPALVATRFLSLDFWALRLPAAVSFMAGCFALFLVTRRLWGPVVALAALAVFGLNQIALIYARYGVSAAGSLCTLLFSLLVCVRLVQTQRVFWAPLAVGCLYIATLGYAPARVPVLVLAVMTPVGILSNTQGSVQRRLAVTGAFALALASVVLFQIDTRSTHFYFEARGEQFFGMFATKYWPDEVNALQTISLATKPLTPGEIVGVGIELVRQVTGPQLLSLLDPLAPTLQIASVPPVRPFHEDPLFLKVMAPALTPFVFIGLLACVRAKDRWLSLTLLTWLALCCGSVLLSNRVDDHRLLFAIIPLSLWAALGISLYARAFKLLKCPQAVILSCGAMFCAMALIPRMDDMYDPPGQENPAIAATREVLRQVPAKDITLAADMFHRDATVLRMDLWRGAANGGQRVKWLSPHYKDALERGTILYRPQIAAEMAEQVKKGSTLVLYPASRYQKAASRLADQSVFVFSQSVGAYAFLIVSGQADVYSSLFQKAILPEIPEERREPPVLAQASGVPLSSLVPLKHTYGFGQMRLNKTWGGTSLAIAGVSYQSGVGVHSPTTLRYAVPLGATSFQAIVAIDDDAEVCGCASARVALRDQYGTLLHQTGVITSTRPTAVSVSLDGVTELEIQVTDANDGRDCDHVDIVDALFVVPPGAPAACVCPKPICSQN